ncbi:tryptophan--tRNA ligase [Thermofilum pendens]|uniref:Tryptophan--tRNA ligase n=1 Tax=Thermofilum pendens (strain DSM 2475 / Hrk 5) TaxID=368408 RepID=A1RXR2_THEPD|nr:tryptophan--tRNA ligase [Thermofilum pendens]ABL77992.1 tryptophanyl-tRNA synthetase [Thermofilum pendens Hrk 5]
MSEGFREGDFSVTPWEAKGKIDYDKLIQEFGVEKLGEELLSRIERIAGGLHPLLRRNFFFAHRDLNLVLNDYEEGRGFFLYTGRAPSNSPMHIAHIVPFIATRWFQEKFGANVYIQIPDEEKFLAKKVETLEEIEKYAVQDILNIIALGFDENKTFIFRDTEYISKLYKPAVLVARHINFSTARAVFGFDNESTIGLIFYPALQIVPTFFEKKRPLIPCGIDQDPYFRLQRDIAPRLNRYKAAEVLSKLVWGLKGPETKMSASEPDTAILLSDPPETVKRKIINAYTGGRATVEEQRRLGGVPEVCTVFHWYSVLFEDDDKKLLERYHACRTGKLLCGECKAELVERINSFLERHRARVKDAEKKMHLYLYDGKLAQEMWNWEYRP